MQHLLQDKVALVTGGTRGIGKAIAKRFIESGANVVFVGTNDKLGQEVIEEFKSLLKDQQKCLFVKLDVSKTGDVDLAIKGILESFGKIDILVNNAGITKDNLLLKMSEEEWDDVLNINLKSVYNTSRAVIRSMIKARQGKIINITSVVGLMGNPGQTNYAASKAGMIGFTKSLAKEVASRNICINCIAPGFIETSMTDALNETQKAAVMGQIPLQKLGAPEDIANAALFLASEMGRYITGQVLPVDGGMVMH